VILQLEHPMIGTAKSIANPIRFSRTPVSYRMPPLLLGEHTSEILLGLGYTTETFGPAIPRPEAAPPGVAAWGAQVNHNRPTPLCFL
jgi:hypothetical protein